MAGCINEGETISVTGTLFTKSYDSDDVDRDNTPYVVTFIHTDPQFWSLCLLSYSGKKYYISKDLQLLLPKTVTDENQVDINKKVIASGEIVRADGSPSIVADQIIQNYSLEQPIGNNNE